MTPSIDIADRPHFGRRCLSLRLTPTSYFGRRRSPSFDVLGVLLRKRNMITRHIAVINQSKNLTPAELAQASAAVQKQVTVDFGPIWEVSATVDAFPDLESMPQGYWPVVVQDDIGINVPGIHLSDGGEKAFALVLFTGSKWTQTLSHEIIDLLLDPFGKTFLTGPSVRPDQATVEYLVEVCDPCQASDCGYAVNGLLMSDFVLPEYYKGFGAGKYSFARHITEPRTVSRFGYVTWRDPITEQWWQLIDTGDGATTQTITVDASLANVHLRGLIDRATDKQLKAAMQKFRNVKAAPISEDHHRVHALMSRYAETTAAQARWWSGQLQKIANTIRVKDGKPKASRTRKKKG
jgi:hypothetical protein